MGHLMGRQQMVAQKEVGKPLGHSRAKIKIVFDVIHGLVIKSFGNFRQEELLCYVQKCNWALLHYCKALHSYSATDHYCYYNYGCCYYCVLWRNNKKLRFGMEKSKFLEMFHYSQITCIAVVSQVPLVL